jgi:hypothetical protein
MTIETTIIILVLLVVASLGILAGFALSSIRTLERHVLNLQNEYNLLIKLRNESNPVEMPTLNDQLIKQPVKQSSVKPKAVVMHMPKPQELRNKADEEAMISQFESMLLPMDERLKQ